MLSDDIVLSIMARVNTTTAARTSVLSTLWKHLPWLLCELTIDVKDFFTYPGWAASLRSVCFKKKLRAASLSGLAHKTICSSSVSKFLQIGFKFPM